MAKEVNKEEIEEYNLNKTDILWYEKLGKEIPLQEIKSFQKKGACYHNLVFHRCIAEVRALQHINAADDASNPFVGGNQGRMAKDAQFQHLRYSKSHGARSFQSGYKNLSQIRTAAIKNAHIFIKLLYILVYFTKIVN